MKPVEVRKDLVDPLRLDYLIPMDVGGRYDASAWI